MRPANQPPTPPQLPADPAGHLPLLLLRQYVAGALPAAEQHRIEAHTLTCARCADVLEGLAATDAATTEAALATLRTRLHQRVAAEAAPRRGALAWRAAAAVLLLLVLSTAAWFGLRPSRPALDSQSVVTTTTTTPPPPASSSAAPPKMSAPVAVETARPAAAPEAEIAATPPAAIQAPRIVAPAARRVAYARRPSPAAPPAAATTAAVSDSRAGADLAVMQTERAAETQDRAAPVAAAAPAPAAGRAQPAAVAPDTVATGMLATAKMSKAKSNALREESADRKVSLPPAVIISPQPVGGYRALREYLHHEKDFKPEAPAQALEGSVRLKFTVTAAGKLENFKILKGMRDDYDAEAIRLLCEGPAWQPGAANGRRADQVVEISVVF